VRKYFIPVIILVFITLSALFYGAKMYLPEYNLNLLMGGNIILAALSIISFLLISAQMTKKPAAFIRGVQASNFLKLFVCVVSVVVYVMINKPHVHKPSLFVLMGIYAVYSIIETWLLSRLAKEVK
jgi:hypothetical protein